MKKIIDGLGREIFVSGKEGDWILQDEEGNVYERGGKERVLATLERLIKKGEFKIKKELKKLVITFNKEFEENLLIGILTSILKNLHNKKKYFFIDDILINKKGYNIVFRGQNYKILIEEIKKYLKIDNFEEVN